MNGNVNMTYENLWIVAKEVIGGNSHIIKEKTSQIKNFSFHLYKRGKKEQLKTSVCKRKKIRNIRAEIKELENRKNSQQNQKLIA